MIDEKKQIEEMVHDMCIFYDNGKCGNEFICEKPCATWNKAERLHNAGYRKIPENAVVLTREEYGDMFTFKTVGNGGIHCGFYNILDTVRKVERKETAREIANEVKLAFYREFDELIPSIMADKIDEIAKQYGVEMKE